MPEYFVEDKLKIIHECQYLNCLCFPVKKDAARRVGLGDGKATRPQLALQQ
jgi:hypothetical protein